MAEEIKLYLETNPNTNIVKSEYEINAVKKDVPILSQEKYSELVKLVRALIYSKAVELISNEADYAIDITTLEPYYSLIKTPWYTFYGIIDPLKLINDGNQVQKTDSLNAQVQFKLIIDEEVERAEALFNALKAIPKLKEYFPSDNDKKAKQSLKKIFLEVNQVLTYFSQNDSKWRRLAENYFDKPLQNSIIICADPIEVVLENGKKGKILVNSALIVQPENVIGTIGDNTLTLSKSNERVFLRKVQRDDYTFCYKIESTVSEKLYKILGIGYDILDEEDQKSIPASPIAASEEAKKREEAIREAAKSVFGDMDIFDQQCILLKMIDRILPLTDQEQPENFIKLEVGGLDEARAVSNILDGSPYYAPFINIPNYILSTLVPKIKLYKSYVAKNDRSQIDLEIPMEEFVDQNDVLEGKIARGFGFGLQSFSWNNSSFNEVDRNIDASLVLKFSNMDSFVQTRKSRLVGLKNGSSVPDQEELEKFRFIELIYQAPTLVNASKEDIAQEAQIINRFHIKVEVGWSYNNNVLADLVPNTTERENLKKAIDANTTIYYLFNKGHDLSFEKDGSVKVSINYQSAQEAKMNDERYSSIFLTTNQQKEKKIKELEERIKENKKALEEGSGRQQELEKIIKESEEEKLSIENQLARELYINFIEEIFKTKKIKLLGINASSLIRFKSSLTPTPDKLRPNLRRLTDLENKIYESAPGVKEQEKVQQIIDQKLTGDGERIFAYITFGDLISIVSKRINNLPDVDRYDLLRIITGPYVYQKFTSVSTQKQKAVIPIEDADKYLSVTNMADIPISFNYFISWFEDEIIKKGKKNYTARNFFSNLLNKFLLQVLRPNCFGKDFTLGTFKIDLNLLNVFPIENGIKDPISGQHKKNIPSGKKKLSQIKRYLDSSTNNRDYKEQLTYIYLQLLYTKQNFIIVDEAKNASQGMYHLRLGVDRGLVKDINFSRDDNKFIATAIYSQQGAINPKVLAVPYNAEVSMVGNNIFKPGNLVYIDPTFVLSTSNQVDLSETGKRAIDEMRLGGFYLITGTKNAIESGKFSTNITCRYVAAGK